MQLLLELTLKKTLRTAICFITLLAGILAISPAMAQTSVPFGEFSADRFVPVPGSGNYLVVDGARVRGHLAPSAGLTLNYAHRPFVLFDATCDSGASDCSVGDEDAVIVKYLATATLTGALTLFDRLQVGLIVPFSLVSGEQFAFTSGEQQLLLKGGSSGGVGDPRLHIKVGLYGKDQGPAFALVAYASAPLGQATADGRYIGDKGPTFGGYAVGEYVVAPFRVAANVGGVWRDKQQLFSTEVGPQMTYSLAAGYDITPLVTVFGELQGATGFSAELDENPLEGRIAGRIRHGDFNFTLAAGGGLISGVGVPLFRVVAAAAWVPVQVDGDEDGIDDEKDLCPTEGEDRDGYLDDDGCPDRDNDGDGVPDERDRCVAEPEDNDRHQDQDGCPDRDNDGDGVSDGYDSCPNQAEDRDGDRDEDGCPDNDKDRDGVADNADQCPDQQEDTDGYSDEDGCPDPDNDGDGLLDNADQCVDQAEDKDNFEDEDGCPEEGRPAPPPAGRRRGAGRRPR